MVFRSNVNTGITNLDAKTIIPDRVENKFDLASDGVLHGVAEQVQITA
jgi:hypothetical protein